MSVELHGHRGARGLLPENTIEGFKAAIALGVDFIEIDVGLSRDGQVVIHHDLALNPDIAQIGGVPIRAKSLVRSLSVAELKKYDVGRLRPESEYGKQFPNQKVVDGAKIPTLGELLSLHELLAKPDVRLNIEIKTSPELPDATVAPEVISAVVLREIDAHRFRERCRVQSFDWRNLVHLRELAPDLELGFLTPAKMHWKRIAAKSAMPGWWSAGFEFEAATGSLVAAIRRAGGRHWGPYFGDVTAEDVRIARMTGLKVNVWTVNELPDIQRMQGLGVDAITTDYPDRGRQVLGRS